VISFSTEWAVNSYHGESWLIIGFLAIRAV
jgi:hypothetical protein